MPKKILISYDFGKNEIQNAVIHKLGSAPSSPVAGQTYYDTTTNCEMFYNGSGWVPKDATKATNIPLSALATNPVARANHTGTQLASTISDFDTQVRTSTLNQMAAPTGSLSMNTQKITNLAAPTAGTNDAARIVDVENAVQSAAAGIDSKQSVRLVAVSNIASLSGLSAIDGVTPIAGDRILLTGQTTTSQNGPYVAAAGAWSRATDADQTGEITPGAFWFVEEGTTYNKTQWRCSNTGTITIGTTGITITQFGAATSYTNGNGLDLTGNTFSVKPVSGGNITVTASGVDVDTTKVVRKYSAAIGDSSTTSYTVTHNLNNQDVITQVREVATNKVVEVDITNTGVNTVVIDFASAPASNAYRVVVQG